MNVIAGPRSGPDIDMVRNFVRQAYAWPAPQRTSHKRPKWPQKKGSPPRAAEWLCVGGMGIS